ncbi:TPA: hypothetical protein LVN30_000934 [Klebsiella oxytoca]|nr:hypothetical protein [Klebsiella oxytoca]
MTLLEILVRELPKRGGWPAQFKVAHTDGGRLKIVFESSAFMPWGAPWSENMDIEPGIVTREQYEAALAAVEPEWNGDGLPPVGVNCEIIFEDDTPPKWYSFVATFIGSNHIVALVGMEDLTYKKSDLLRPGVKFRAICSEATRKRDESIDFIAELCRSSASNGHSAELIYDAIAAGKIPHLKIV